MQSSTGSSLKSLPETVNWATIFAPHKVTDNVQPHPFTARERAFQPDTSRSQSPSSQNQEKETPGTMIRCATCNASITSHAKKISVNTRHDHVFSNPNGILYQIRCFSEAPGCITQGPATDDFTWFAGFTWQVALCGSCLSHLGWRYRGEAPSSFFGLIATSITD